MGWFSSRSTRTPPPPPPPLPPPPSQTELTLAGAHKGLQVGAILGLALSPIVHIAVRRHLPARRSQLRLWYYDVLPRCGATGLAGGALVGAAKAYQIANSNTELQLQVWAHGDSTTAGATRHTWLRPTSESRRREQWDSLGTGIGALISSPGTGSMLFQETGWLARFGGGLAVGAAVGTLCFLASCHPALETSLEHLPAGMQPEGAVEWTSPPAWLRTHGRRELLQLLQDGPSVE